MSGGRLFPASPDCQVKSSGLRLGKVLRELSSSPWRCCCSATAYIRWTQKCRGAAAAPGPQVGPLSTGFPRTAAIWGWGSQDGWSRLDRVYSHWEVLSGIQTSSSPLWFFVSSLSFVLCTYGDVLCGAKAAGAWPAYDGNISAVLFQTLCDTKSGSAKGCALPASLGLRLKHCLAVTSKQSCNRNLLPRRAGPKHFCSSGSSCSVYFLFLLLFLLSLVHCAWR